MSAEADAQKLELLRTALPKGLSAGDSGLGGLNSKQIVQQSAWPQFTTSTSESKLYTPNPTPAQSPSIATQASALDIPFHPWQILLRTVDDATEYKIEYNSTLYSGLNNWNNIAITGLNSWTPASVGFLVIFGVVENGACIKASIQGPETIPSDRIDFVDDVQVSFAAQIGYIYKVEESWFVRQLAFHNFTLIQTCVDGKAALYPFAT